MKWSEKAWERITPIYTKIVEMPFNQELKNGTLPVEKFKFYMAQDAYYLGEFGRALSTIAGRMEKMEHILDFSQFAAGAIVVERALHESYFKTLGIPDLIKPSPSCLLYTNYLLKEAKYADVAVAVAAILPCFWIYKKVGDHIYHQQYEIENNPYKNWIDTYAGEEFAASVHKAIDITDELASEVGSKTQEDMYNAFEMASRLEWMFWDSAYRLEEWPV
ncbi:thiaminase II [Mongoliitalea daihaiensis]|uniref:thiaminase II n=1 Tax=Mongoliitalea daihaiensis TaxID=2782006 RepID=UPI001F28D7FF|nr:thiaminase II [Mongoliitalea daihaiensis]UJP66191.1 thiaminase II [Mongoliitalea daihaiensis]